MNLCAYCHHPAGGHWTNCRSPVSTLAFQPAQASGLVCGACLAPYPGHTEDCPTRRFTPVDGMRALHPDTVTLRGGLAELKRIVAALEAEEGRRVSVGVTLREAR